MAGSAIKMLTSAFAISIIYGFDMPFAKVANFVFMLAIAAVAAPGGKTLVVAAKNLSAENKYVKSVTLNGKPLDKTIEHADIMAGGELVFEMTSRKSN